MKLENVYFKELDDLKKMNYNGVLYYLIKNDYSFIAFINNIVIKTNYADISLDIEFDRYIETFRRYELGMAGSADEIIQYYTKVENDILVRDNYNGTNIITLPPIREIPDTKNL